MGWSCNLSKPKNRCKEVKEKKRYVGNRVLKTNKHTHISGGMKTSKTFFFWIAQYTTRQGKAFGVLKPLCQGWRPFGYCKKRQRQKDMRMGEERERACSLCGHITWGEALRGQKRGRCFLFPESSFLHLCLLLKHPMSAVLWLYGDLSFLFRGEVPFSAFTTPFSW